MNNFADDQMMEEQMEADHAAAAYQSELEVREIEELDWQSELDNDSGYHAWIDELEAEENERRFNVLTAWDEVA